MDQERIFKSFDEYIHRGKLKKAIAQYEAWLDSHPDSVDTRRCLADLYAMAGRNEEAIKQYRMAAWRIMNDPEEDPRKAAAIYELILGLDPSDEDARQALAKLSDRLV